MSPSDDITLLRDRAAALRAVAEASSRRYERTAWIKFAAVFIPVPFAVLLLRTQLEAWGYYLAGGLFVAVAVTVLALDGIAVARRDAAAQAAHRAEQAHAEAARRGGPHGFE